jgi:hypothetical protein
VTFDPFPATPEMTMTAAISSCGRYRHELRRIWDKARPVLVVCMLNPSTADHTRNDPTILALIWFARLWGYGSLLVVNLHDYRSPSPREMMAFNPSVSPDCGRYIEGAFTLARGQNTPVLAAWGNGGNHLGRDEWFMSRARLHLVDLVCLGRTKDGFPKHPLARGVHRIPRDQRPIVFRRAVEVA